MWGEVKLRISRVEPLSRRFDTRCLRTESITMTGDLTSKLIE